MRQNIENFLYVTVQGVDLTTVTGLQFWIRQGKNLFEYIPEVKDSTTMFVAVPFDDAMKLSSGTVDMQFAFTDASRHPEASDIVTMPVERLLKEAGYGPS